MSALVSAQAVGIHLSPVGMSFIFRCKMKIGIEHKFCSFYKMYATVYQISWKVTYHNKGNCFINKDNLLVIRNFTFNAEGIKLFAIIVVSKIASQSTSIE